MREMPFHRFRKHLRQAVEGVVQDRAPLRVTRRGGGDFVVIGAEDWEREQETLYVLQNRSLMEQIARSVKTHRRHRPPDEVPPLREIGLRYSHRMSSSGSQGRGGVS